MKYIKSFRILAVALSITLLLTLMPATPALAQTLILRPDHAKIGRWVDVDGSGFTTVESVRFYFSDESASVADRIGVDVINYEYLGSKTVVDDTFQTEFSFQVPDNLTDGDDVESVRGGTYYVYATDYSGDILVKKAFTVESVVEIEIDPEEGTVGTEVEITGLGFGDREYVTVEYEGDEVSIESGGRTDSDGELTCTILIPESIAGDHTITVTGDESHIEAEIEFTVEPEIAISSESGVAGDTVTVSGTGFGYRVDIEVLFDNDEVATDDTDRDGNFHVSFVVPSIGTGTYDVEVEDDDGNYAEAEFTIAAASMNINPATGYVNTEVTVSGTGFQASKSITISFDNENVSTTTADEYGKVSATFNVPVRGAGTFIVKVSDGINTAQANFTISTSASISPKTSASSPGHVGTALTVSGVGFITGTPVTVSYDGTQVATATVDANGSFSAKFNAPASIGGQHTVIASIGTATETFTFFMDSTAPQWPSPLKPEMGIEAEAETYFDWGDVTDPSGVTYTLQIATSEGFSEGLLEMTGIQQSEYTLTSEEKLERRSEENPYYWRVRAVDGASNVSEWTLPGTFYVGGGFSWHLPRPVLITLIVIGALAVIVLGFWFGRKTAYY